ncbi:hypothetical protein [Actinomadura macrotermitis]|uniref:Uncharacterized protein n=1 Tax=Actinomadura macrotermitis TaxID=2585200 RepID=A0A7K0BNH6_9ACTN|nr:hypothetical protein [Actinomadura macrotermitis]MQY02749.1 hypothetical protein [Actinomadura macrotermitis]
MRSRARYAAFGLSGALLGAPLLVSPAAAAPGTLVVERGGPARTLRFTAGHAGEAVIGFTAAAPGVSWARKGAEAAVVSFSVDGRHVTDLVVPSADGVARSLGLGPVGPGAHTVTLRFARGSAPAARRVVLTRPAVRLPGGDQAVLRHAPVVVGRTGWPFGDPYQNARTDTPLVAWHESRPAAGGHRVLEYSLVWSNEDGGTDTPALMSRWGRSTDIEWVYRVEVDAAGRRVPDTGVYQAPLHQTLRFTGRYEGDHPVLQTCTDNNNMCDVVSPNAPLRFLPDASATRPADRAREVIMDRNPWTYRVAAQELVREGKIEKRPDPATKAVGDPRTYLFVEYTRTAGAATGQGSAPGVALGVRLKADPSRLYRSDHGDRSVAIDRDGAVATTVELPAGTSVGDIASVEALRTPVGSGDNGAPVTVTSVHRGFFLDRAYLPRPSAIRWTGAATLTGARPTAVLWRN